MVEAFGAGDVESTMSVGGVIIRPSGNPMNSDTYAKMKVQIDRKRYLFLTLLFCFFINI